MNYAEDEKTIDLMQFFYYILRHWKQILIILMIGVLLGSGFSLIRGQKTLEDYTEDEISKLNTEKILQYNRARQLYEMQQNTNSQSILLQMDPNRVYRTSRYYHLTLPANSINLMTDRYEMLIADNAILDELIAAGGLDCDYRAIKELVSLTFTKVEPSNAWEYYGLKPQSAKVALSVIAPNKESGEAMLAVLDAHVTTLQQDLASEYSQFSCEELSASSQFGYDNDVWLVREAALEIIKDYENEIVSLKKGLTEDDMNYYAWKYHPEDIEFSLAKQTVKFALLFGILLGIMACGFYGVLFLFDDHIKTVNDIVDYGLYAIACIQADTNKKQKIVDRIMGSKNVHTNSREYLLNALRTLCTGKTILCGNKQDAQTAELMNWLVSQMDETCATDLLARDENGVATAKASEGAVLFVRLWQTTNNDLKRELFVLKQLGKNVKGVVVLQNQ